MKRLKSIIMYICVVVIFGAAVRYSSVEMHIVSNAYTDGISEGMQCYFNKGNGFVEEDSISEYERAEENTKYIIKTDSSVYDTVSEIRCNFMLKNQTGYKDLEPLRISSISFKKSGFQLLTMDQLSTEVCYAVDADWTDDGLVIIGPYPSVVLLENITSLLKTRIKYLHFFLMTAVIVLTVVWDILWTKFVKGHIHDIKNGLKKTETLIDKYFTVFFCTMFILLVLILYKDFLSGEKAFISTNGAMDMYDQFYPNYLNRAEYIENGDTDIQMDFSIALGMEIDFGFPEIDMLPAYFGVENVAYLMGIVQILKMILAGICSYFYFCVIGKKKYVSAIGAIAYTMCGYMLVRQFWLSYSTIVTLFALWLLCFELWYVQKDIRWLPIATFLFMVNLQSVYYVLLYVLIMVAYVVFRFIYEGRFKEICTKGAAITFVIGSICILSYGLLRFVNHIIVSLHSERFSTGIQEAGLENTWVISKDALFTLIARTIGIDTLKCGKACTDLMGYLGGPVFYIGLLYILLLIPAWCAMKKRKKVLIAIIGVMAAVYIFVDPLRRMVNGYADSGFKLSSFWILVLGVYVVTEMLDHLLDNIKPRQMLIIIVEAVLIELFGAKAIVNASDRIDAKMMLFSMGMTLIYLFILQYHYLSGGKWNIYAILLCVVFLETGVVANNCLSNMEGMLDMSTLNERVRYNDYTKEILERIETANDRQDYRINKQYFSYRYNDAWAQGYYGTSFYLGGTGAGKNITRLYDDLKLPSAGAGYKYAYGTGPYTEVNTILGVKYILNTNNKIMNYGYDEFCSDYGIYAMENKNGLSMGYGYDSYMTYDDYINLDVNLRRKCLIHTCVVDQPESVKKVQPVNYKDTAFDMTMYKEYKQQLFCGLNGRWRLGEKLEDGNVLVISADFNMDESQYRAILKYSSENKLSEYRVRIDPHERQVFEINAPLTSSFDFFYDDGKTKLPIEQIECYVIPQEIYYKEYNAGVEKLAFSQLDVQNFSGKYISGEATCNRSMIYCLAVPYGNWRVTVDGKEVDTFLLNVAFTGFEVDAGKHFIEAKYVNNQTAMHNISNWILFVLCSMWIVVATIWYRARYASRGRTRERT